MFLTKFNYLEVWSWISSDSPILVISLHSLNLTFCLLSLWSPPFRFRGPLFSILIASTLYITQHNPFPRDISTRFSLAMLWYIYLGTISKILLFPSCSSSSSLESTYWRIDHPQEAVSMPGFSREKLKWALALLVNMRGIGWNWRVKGIPMPGKEREEGKWAFVIRIGGELVLGLVTLTMCTTYIAERRYPRGLEARELTVGFGERVYLILAVGVQSYLATSFNYQILSIIGVASGLSEPKEWPPLFGSLRESTTIRYFWGNFWHQGIRKVLSGYTQFMLRLLNVPPHTVLSSLLTVFITFTLSGLYHGYASYALAYPTPTSPYATTYDRFGRWFVFFLLQAFGIILEDVAIRTFRLTRWYKQAKREDKEKRGKWEWQIWLGYCWVSVWMIVTGSVLLDAYLKTDMGLVGTRPSSAQK